MSRKRSPSKTPKTSLHRQGYNFIAEGASAAVKPCLWCKRALRGGESCYKHQFYGIDTWKCVQMTPTLRCNQRCLFCWRSMEHEILSETELSPEKIVAALPKMQKKGLSGDKPYTDPARWEEATEHPTQYALSLSGEPTLYSKLPELIDLLREDPKNSVFVVSNGTMPSVIRRIRPTQLYLSLDAVDVASYERICRPMGDPAAMWGNIQTSLSLLRQKEEEGSRTAVRITLVNGYNDADEAGFAKIIEEAQPLFVEVKGYMYLGYSRMRLTEMHVHDMETIRRFAAGVAQLCNYEIMDENVPSRVVCLKRKS
ncbi:MAG: S-adenosyl-L-methionine-dependent tRNA 4-demethylwyosine synthase [Methanocorpusculum sp. MCE]|nr:MAG: S-adenosyl-L-methionine-dependent tRNA 4-demethylwyosine synthase [Methanocorpusculum sp. MCE]